MVRVACYELARQIMKSYQDLTNGVFYDPLSEIPEPSLQDLDDIEEEAVTNIDIDNYAEKEFAGYVLDTLVGLPADKRQAYVNQVLVDGWREAVRKYLARD